jgi:transcriptional regulator with XRE-family HTH domain
VARRVGVSRRSWYGYETGVTVPPEVLLSFIELTNVNPTWVLCGEGPKYRGEERGPEAVGGSPVNSSSQARSQVADRLRTIRFELFGERGGAEVARRLGVSARTWLRYETGATVPPEVLLSYIELTKVNPTWLLFGNGPRYARHDGSLDLEGESLEDSAPPENVHPLIWEAERAFHRDLELLLKERAGQWVAYHGAKKIAFGASKRQLYELCLSHGIPRCELLILCIEPETCNAIAHLGSTRDIAKEEVKSREREPVAEREE